MSVQGLDEMPESRFPASLMSTQAHGRALLALCFILGGMLALPMLPGWQGAARLLAAVVLALALPGVMPRRLVQVWLAALLVLAALVGLSWLQSAASSPGRHVIGMITDVYGLALPLYGGLALVGLDLALLLGLARLLLSRSVAGRIRLGFALALVVWLCSLSGPLIRGPGVPELLGQMLAGSAEWGGWVLLMGLSAMLVRGAADIRVLVIGLVLGGGAMALVMALQFVLGDFAYVLDTPDLRDYFYRVRGTAYYHAPATYTVAITLMLTLGLLHASSRKPVLTDWRRWGWAYAVLALAVIVSLNDTRALNVGLVVALGLMALLLIWRRDWPVLVMSGLLMIWISADMLYIKPTIGASEPGLSYFDSAFQSKIDSLVHPPPRIDTGEEIELPTLGTVDPSVSQTLVGSNSVRILLTQAGLLALPDYVIIGSGVGTLELNLGGIAGLTTTYSTHMLYADIALMAGVPAIIAFVSLLLAAFWNGLVISLWRPHLQKHSMAPAVLCASMVLGLGAIFLPQERNHIAALFFVFAGLLLAMDKCRLEPKVAALRTNTMGLSRMKLLAGVLGIGAIGWGALTSAAITLPVLNLAGGYADEIAESGAEVYVTDPIAVPLTRALLRLRGVPDPQVKRLADDPALLPQDNAFIIWHPARDARYPHLNAALRYRLDRPGSDAPSLELPSGWWMRDVIPYAGYLLHAAARPAVEVFGEELVATDIPPDMPLLPNAGRFVGFGINGYANTMLPRDMLDMSAQTRRVWATTEPASFYFDMSKLPPNPLGAYRFIPPATPDAGFSRQISWRLEGSDDLKTWEMLDARNTTWSEDVELPSGFAISNPRLFRYLRLQFDPKVTPSLISSLSDIELYPTPLARPAAAPQSQ